MAGVGDGRVSVVIGDVVGVLCTWGPGGTVEVGVGRRVTVGVREVV